MTSPTARTIDPATLLARLDAEPPRLLDVRTPAEFEAAHIPGSYNVPLDLLREHRREVATAIDQDVVLVCRSGARAAQAGQALAQVGLPGVRVLLGGLSRGTAVAPDTTSTPCCGPSMRLAEIPDCT